MNSCLVRRVWCYQEDLLSPRKIHFCKDQLYWHCDHANASEDRLIDGASPLQAVADVLTSSDSHAQDVADQLSKYWYEEVISEDYSKREATYERDRLVAVSGLAKRVGAAMKSNYLLGLWESTVVYGLNWASETSTRTKIDGVPSWSWASQQGGISYTRVENPVCTFIRADIGYLNPDDLFGDVTSAALTLRGKFFSMDELPPRQNVFFEGAWDDHGFDPADNCIMMLPLDTDTCWERITLLLVTASASDPSRHTRVGHGSWHGGPWQDGRPSSLGMSLSQTLTFNPFELMAFLRMKKTFVICSVLWSRCLRLRLH